MRGRVAVAAVPWAGGRLAALDYVGAQPAPRAGTFRSLDGSYTESLTLEQARRDDVIVAYSMLGKPVTRAHGGPVRLYVAPMYMYGNDSPDSDPLVEGSEAPGPPASEGPGQDPTRWWRRARRRLWILVGVASVALVVVTAFATP